MPKPKLSNTYNAYSSSYQYSRSSLLYVVVILLIASLIIGIYSLIGLNELKSNLLPKTIDIKNFLGKLTEHDELSPYKNLNPLNIVQINQQNLPQLQQQITGLNTAHVGKFLVQYSDRVILYDYNRNVIEANTPTQQQQQVPQDFFAKLSTHPEAQSYVTTNPVGGKLDEASLATLKQQLPDVYKNAKIGDYLLRFPTGLVIYDYSSDKVINVIPLSG